MFAVANVVFVYQIFDLQVTEQELINLVEENLPDHCNLRAGVKFLDKLPRTTTGKISKKQLRDMFVN